MEPRVVHRRAGMTLVETIVSMAIALVTIGVVVQVLLLTVRTTSQTSAQADTQGAARRALQEWERQLRDGFAVLTEYTLQSGARTRYQTRFTVHDPPRDGDEQTVVAALPSIDANGAPCTWRGTNMVFDCVVWRAKWEADENGTWAWNLYRVTVPGAFQMPQGPFFAGNLPEDPRYAPPQALGRASELTPVPVFRRGTSVAVELWGERGVLASPTGAAFPPQVSTSAPLPVWMNADGTQSTQRVGVTDVSVVKARVEYAQEADTLESGQGTTTRSDAQSVEIRLRNKQTW